MTFSELLSRLGGLGRFQVALVAGLALPLLMLASHNLLQNFTAGVPGHRCRPRPGANGTAGPVPGDGRCRRYAGPPPGPNGTLGDVAAANGTQGWPTEPCRDGWIYEDGVFADTIVTEWDLVCEARSWRQVAQSIYMAGILVGSVVFGILSDKWGRRPLLRWCYLQLGVAGTAAALAPTFGLYCLSRGLAGLAMAGVSLNSASLCMEWIPTELRAAVGTVNGYCYTLGQFVLAAAAFGLPRWRRLQLCVSLPFYLFFLYSWLFAESARWQVSAGRPRGALRGLRRVARVNGRREEGDKLDLEVRDQLRLLRAGPGPAALRARRARDADGLRRRGPAGQAALGAGHGRPGAPREPGRGPGAGGRLRPRQRRRAPRAAAAPLGLRRGGQGRPGRLLQLRLRLHRGALPHRGQADGAGPGRHHGPRGQHGGAAGAAGGRRPPGAALRGVRRRAGPGRPGRPRPARDAGGAAARHRGGRGAPVGPPQGPGAGAAGLGPPGPHRGHQGQGRGLRPPRGPPLPPPSHPIY